MQQLICFLSSALGQQMYSSLKFVIVLMTPNMELTLLGFSFSLNKMHEDHQLMLDGIVLALVFPFEDRVSLY